jgi:hypothetical protein
LAELLVLSKLAYLPLHLGERGRSREGLADSPAINFVRQSIVWAVGGLVGLVTTAIGFAAAARSGSDRTWPEIAKVGQIPHDQGTLLLQNFEGLLHV